MDSISQAALGAAVGEVFLGKKGRYKGALCGAIVGTIPDLDIVLLPFFDSIERISIHRGYSHSIIFSVLGAFLIAFLLKRMKWSTDFNFWRLYLFSFLGLFTHMLLDAFTAYGTQLFLPFSDYRVSFDSVNIVDPFYTLPLLAGLIATLYLKNKNANADKWNRLGLLISSLYLVFTLVNKSYIHNLFTKTFSEHGIVYNQMHSIPVAIGNVNWYGVARNDSTLFMGKYSELKRNEIQFESFPINDELLRLIEPALAEKLKWFAQELYVVAEDNGKVRVYNMQCDMQGIRYFGDYKAPTAFYFEVTPKTDGSFSMTTGMHPSENNK